MTRTSAQPGNTPPSSRSNHSAPHHVSHRFIRSAILAAAFAFLSHAAAAPDEARRLEDLRTQIESLEGDLGKSRSQRKEVHTQLRDVERRIGDIAARIRRIASQERELNVQLRALAESQRQLEKVLAQHHQSLEQQVRARYAQGEQGFLRMLLNQPDMGLIGRNLVYYQYLNQAHAEGIGRINEDMVRLDDLKAQSQKRREELQEIGTQLAEQKGAMELEKAQRAQLMAGLEQRIGSQKQQLEQLNADAARLEEVMRNIRAAPHRITPSSLPFVRQKGKLPWPVKGEQLAGYGQARNLGKLKWEGVLIGAAEGVDVVAVANGRVVYADWLRGYGMLMIVDHGSGYFTLYGYNQGLQKNVGDAVTQGEVIASVGNSGGNDRPALYFEIRKDGKPSNPATWCRGSRPG